jgi:hypothetical protein
MAMAKGGGIQPARDSVRDETVWTAPIRRFDDNGRAQAKRGRLMA